MIRDGSQTRQNDRERAVLSTRQSSSQTRERQTDDYYERNSRDECEDPEVECEFEITRQRTAKKLERLQMHTKRIKGMKGREEEMKQNWIEERDN